MLDKRCKSKKKAIEHLKKFPEPFKVRRDRKWLDGNLGWSETFIAADGREVLTTVVTASKGAVYLHG